MITSPPYHLLNAVERNAEHPDTFAIPDRQERETLSEGMIVKIALEREDGAYDLDSGPAGERFWVIVKRRTRRHGAVAYIGEVNNDLVASWHRYQLGDAITFGPEHVLDIDEGRIPTPDNVVPLRGGQ